MKELSLQEQFEINGGGAFTTIIYCIIGVGLFKVITSKKGRISIPKLITYEWSR